jgi:hypothetical protein
MGLIFAVILVIAIIGGIFWFFQSIAVDSAKERLEEFNRRTGLSFSWNMFLGWGGTGLLFDNESKKICLVSGGHPGEVVDYSYIKSWQLNWDEHLNKPLARYSNVYFVFQTSDLARPLIKVKIFNKAMGDEWHAKLGILFD